MHLIYHKIPAEFLSALPDGMKYLHRHGHEFLVVEELTCPNGHSLMAESVRIHGEPSIRVDIRRGDERGSIYLDAFWGSHAKLFSFVPSSGEAVPTVEAVCPACGTSLDVEDRCALPGCGSERAVLFRLPGGSNRIYVCARLGCPGHRLVVTHIPHTLNREVSEINYFGHGEEELFRGV